MYIIIGGGGALGRRLAARLVEARHDVVVIDRDRDVCEAIYASTGALTVCGNVTEIDVLDDAGITKADVLVAATRSDADNLALSLLAGSFSVQRIFARMRNPGYKVAYLSAGVTRVIDPVQSFSDLLFLEIEQPEVRVIAEMGKGKASLGIIRAGEKTAGEGIAVRDLAAIRGFPEECVIVGLYREEADEFVLPRGNAVIRADDQVFIAASAEGLAKAAKILSSK